MILNACTKTSTMVDEHICKNCEVQDCRHAGEPTVKETLDAAIYGTADYWNGETDDAI